MGEHEISLPPTENGRLGDMGSSQWLLETDNHRPLNISDESWFLAEKTTDRVIRKIQPTKVSEERRKNIIEYIQKLVRGCLGYEIYPFGSVPLITYLPDGDIDLTALGPPNSEDFLSGNVRAALEAEEWNNDNKFEVKDVQCIQAEVKLVKCLVQNVVVDISFNSIGGLCTLCFLDEVDSKIGKDHLFKRTIILIKAWCYYESRILGAHHNLISTYALETLILYIFHLFHSYLDEPLAVLYRFLDYFSKFDWANLGVSLRGPVLLSSLPEIVVEVLETDEDDLLFSSDFLNQCEEKNSVHHRASENNRLFVKKYLNIVDPLKENNNLGRSVSKGNLYRIRSAFGYGARKLGKILLSSEETMSSELKKFFKNTLERHGNGERPDVQDLYSRSPIDMADINQSEGANGGIDDLSDIVITSNHQQYHLKAESEFKDGNAVLGFHMIDSNSRFENEVSLPSPNKVICTPHLHCGNGQIVEENGNPKEMAVTCSNCLDSSLSNCGEIESSTNNNKNCRSNLRSSSSDTAYRGRTAHAHGNEEPSLLAECIRDTFDVADLAGNHEVHLNNLRYAQCSYDFMNKSLSLGNIPPYSQYPIHGQMVRPPTNGFFSGPPFPNFIPMNPCFIPRPFGLDDMPKHHRGTGTYIPIMNQNGFRENPTMGRVRNHQFPANQIARSQNDGRAMPLPESNTTYVSGFSVFNGNGRGKYGQMDPHRASSGPESSRFPLASGNDHPLENQLQFGSLYATCIDSPTTGNGGKIEGNSPPHIHSPGSAVSTSPLSQKSEMMTNHERLTQTQSYHLKDDEEFPPLSGGGNQTATHLNETKSAWEAARR